MDELLAAFPELVGQITDVCQGRRWCITGASALLHDEEAFYFELTKPKHWRHHTDGLPVVGLGAIGGSLEPHEAVLACLHREAQEELGAGVQVESARETHLVYEQDTVTTVALDERRLPVPVLCTVGRNLYQRQRHPESEILVIVTFLARSVAPPRPADLFGLLAVSWGHLGSILAPCMLPLAQLQRSPDVRILSREPLPAHGYLEPVWTVRSLRTLLNTSRLRDAWWPKGTLA